MSNAVEQVFRDGCLINLHCSWWKGQVKILPQDLGLKSEDVPTIFSLGRKRLYPKAEFDNFMKVEQRARKYVKDNSFYFPIKTVYFVPMKMVRIVSLEIERFNREFSLLTEVFTGKYNLMKEKMIGEYHDIAAKVYNGGKYWEIPKERFVELLVQHVRNKYPTLTSLEQKYDLSYSLFTISAPNLQVTEANVGQVMLENGERDRLTNLYQERMESEIEDFLGDAVVELRNRVSEALVSLKASFESKRSISQRSIKNVSRVIENFKNLNFFGDDEVENILSEFKAEYLNTDASVYKSSGRLLQEFSEAITMVESEIANATDINEVTNSYVRRLTLE